MNGSTLKIVFLSISWTLCCVLLIATAMVLFGKIQVDNYKEVIGVLGIPTFFGMVAQAFIHANTTEKEKENEENPISTQSVVDSKPISTGTDNK